MAGDSNKLTQQTRLLRGHFPQSHHLLKRVNGAVPVATFRGYQRFDLKTLHLLLEFRKMREQCQVGVGYLYWKTKVRSLQSAPDSVQVRSFLAQIVLGGCEICRR